LNYEVRKKSPDHQVGYGYAKIDHPTREGHKGKGKSRLLFCARTNYLIAAIY